MIFLTSQVETQQVMTSLIRSHSEYFNTDLIKTPSFSLSVSYGLIRTLARRVTRM